MSKITQAFGQKKAYIPFFICGDPDLATTEAALRAAVEAGAAMIELNIPFSDPTAGDTTVQTANIRALAGGVTTDKIFDFIEDLRKDVTVPLLISGYANVVFSYGADRFISRCAQIGVDGLIVPDLPFEERGEFLPFCKQYGVTLISMVAATSRQRITAIAKEAEGFLYIMACPGGTQQELSEIIQVVRSVSDIPCAVCISAQDAGQLEMTARQVDGVVEDTALVSLCGKFGWEAAPYVANHVRNVVKLLQESGIQEQ
jgi:tryptophan synthase alpha chain